MAICRVEQPASDREPVAEARQDKNLVQVVGRALEDSQLFPRCPKLEITESHLVQDTERTKGAPTIISPSAFGLRWTTSVRVTPLCQFSIGSFNIDKTFVRYITTDLASLKRSSKGYGSSSSKISLVLGLFLGGRRGACAWVGRALLRRESPLTALTVIFRAEDFFFFLRLAIDSTMS